MINPVDVELKPTARSTLVSALRLLMGKTVRPVSAAPTASAESLADAEDYRSALEALDIDTVFVTLVPSLDRTLSGLSAGWLLALAEEEVRARFLGWRSLTVPSASRLSRLEEGVA